MTTGSFFYPFRTVGTGSYSAPDRTGEIWQAEYHALALLIKESIVVHVSGSSWTEHAVVDLETAEDRGTVDEWQLRRTFSRRA